MASRKRQKRGIHLVQPQNGKPENLLKRYMAATFQTGEVVPQSGIYRVTHAQHRLPHEVTLLRANEFPPCVQCRHEVTFKLLRAVTIDRFSVTLNAIPELPEPAQNFRGVFSDDNTKKAG